MNTEENTQGNIVEDVVGATPPEVSLDTTIAVTPNNGNGKGAQATNSKFRDNKRPRRGGTRRPSFERAKPEFDQKMISIRRVTRVVAGGRRFSFSVVLVIGDRKGSVGVGTGKAGDTSLAIEKAFRSARKNMIKPLLTKEMSIPHDVEAKYSSAYLKLMPNKNRGLVVGSSTRIVCELGGIKNVSAKILSGSKNQLNIAQATIKALKLLKEPRERKEK